MLNSINSTRNGSAVQVQNVKARIYVGSQLNNFVYYTKSQQEQMAIFSWLIKYGYKELNSSFYNTTTVISPIHYDFVCVDISNKEFGFFTGKSNNSSHKIYVALCMRDMIYKIKCAEINQSFTYTMTTSIVPFI